MSMRDYQIAVGLPKPVRDELRRVAAEEQRSEAAVVRLILTAALLPDEPDSSAATPR
jgi:plasmid stability protein